MSFLDDYDRHGQPWNVSIDLSTSTGEVSVVKPTPLHRDPAGIAGDRMQQRYGIVWTGFVYCVSAAAASVGFRVFSRTPGTIEKVVRFEVGTGAANTAISGGSPWLWCPLQPADLSLSPPQGDELFVEVLGTALKQSYVMLWGLHTTNRWDNNYDGSPGYQFPQT